MNKDVDYIEVIHEAINNCRYYTQEIAKENDKYETHATVASYAQQLAEEIQFLGNVFDAYVRHQANKEATHEEPQS